MQRYEQLCSPQKKKIEEKLKDEASVNVASCGTTSTGWAWSTEQQPQMQEHNWQFINEYIKLREDNCKLKEIIRSGIVNESPFEKYDDSQDNDRHAHIQYFNLFCLTFILPGEIFENQL